MRYSSICVNEKDLSPEGLLIALNAEKCQSLFNGDDDKVHCRIAPAMITPFTVYVYETGSQYIKSKHGACTSYGYGKKAVVGRFTCTRIDTLFSESLSADLIVSDARLYAKSRPVTDFLNKPLPREPRNLTCLSCKHCAPDGYCSIGKVNLVPVSRPTPLYLYVREVLKGERH